MQKRLDGLLLPLVIATLSLLGGCGKKDNESSSLTMAETAITPQPYVEAYNCDAWENDNPLKRSWCQAKNLFDLSNSSSLGANALADYVRGFRLGIDDARQARVNNVERRVTKNHTESLLDQGYRAGYESVITQMGIIEFNCTDESEPTSEYRERWCEAAESFRMSGTGSGDNNPFLRARYIDGYMAGGRVALTVPTSMESFLNGDTPEGKQPPINTPKENTPSTELAFYRGFDEGYKAMIASIRESINQVMEQMQSHNDNDTESSDSMSLPPIPADDDQ